MARFDDALGAAKRAAGVQDDYELDANALGALVQEYKSIFRLETGKDVPQDPRVQLREAILGVFRSWSTPRAIAYRKINRITGLLGTAVNVQVSGGNPTHGLEPTLPCSLCLSFVT